MLHIARKMKVNDDEPVYRIAIGCERAKVKRGPEKYENSLVDSNCQFITAEYTDCCLSSYFMYK
jgi:hypothetical protein